MLTSAAVYAGGHEGDGVLSLHREEEEQVTLPWWVEHLNQERPDLSIFEQDWAQRPLAERPLLPDGTRAGPYWDSLDPRLHVC
jgi:hypothetical protein